MDRLIKKAAEFRFATEEVFDEIVVGDQGVDSLVMAVDSLLDQIDEHLDKLRDTMGG